MEAAGVRCELFLYAGQGHAFAAGGRYKTITLIETDKFLKSLGWLTGPPTLSQPK